MVIRKMRNKFILVTMGLLLIVFAILLIGSYAYNSYIMREDTVELLQTSVTEKTFLHTDDPDEAASFTTIYAAAFDSEGHVTDLRSSDRIKDTEDVTKTAEAIHAQRQSTWKWRSYVYVYKDLDMTGDGAADGMQEYLVFAKFNDPVPAGHIIKFIILVAAGILLLFIVTFYLSRFVTRPAQLELEREKQFISDASHELKTPVASIRINAQAMARQAEGNRHLENILMETERMDHLVRRLLKLSYLEEQGQKIHKEVLSLSQLCEEVALSYDSIAFEKHVDFDYDLQPDITYHGAPQELKQLLVILLDNAMKHAAAGERHEGAGALNDSLDEEPGNAVRLFLDTVQGRIRIRVTNTGEGIPEEDLPHIFERFYRSDASRAGNDENFGLGLAIARTITESHGGTITAQSTQQTGTVFTVEL